MKKLWSAASIRVAGSGLSDSAFLPFLSQLIGDHDIIRRTSSTQKTGHNPNGPGCPAISGQMKAHLRRLTS